MPKPNLPGGKPTPDIHDTPPKLRNPDLARPVPMVARPKSQHQAGGSVASNGYWLHDEFGPRHVVAPGEDHGPVSLIEEIEARLGALPDLDASRVHFSLEYPVLRLMGSVEDANSRRRVGACANSVVAAAPGDLRIENRLRIVPKGKFVG